MSWQRGVNLTVGAVLLVLGFLDVHVYVVSIVVGLWLVGTTSGELLEAAISRKAGNHEHDRTTT